MEGEAAVQVEHFFTCASSLFPHKNGWGLCPARMLDVTCFAHCQPAALSGDLTSAREKRF
jgi:hypothetical protein